MKQQFAVRFATIVAIAFFLSLTPLAVQAADSGQTLQQFSQSVKDIVREVNPSIVKIKVDDRRSKAREKWYFKEYLPPDFPRREKDWEQYFKPEQFRFFFEAPDGDDNSSGYKKREFHFSIPNDSDLSRKIQKFLRQKDLPDLPDRRDWTLPTIPYIYPYGDYRQYGLGAGIIVSSDGYIVTANHTVEKADGIKITLSDGREFDAELTGADAKTGIAVIKIEADELTPARLGDSEQLSVGEIVLAIGHPHGFDNTASLGIVSGLGRSANVTEYDNLIQTDAVINPGSSGGPLVNTNGEVVGMNIAMLSDRGYQGIGFAIPINTVKKIQNQLMESGKVVRGWLGIYIQNVSAELAEKFQLEKPQGAMVSNVMDDSPAAHAGLEKGDVIVAFAGKSAPDVKQLRNLVAETEPGKAVLVTVIRDGKEEDIEVTIGEMPNDVTRPIRPRKPSGIEKGRLGVIVQDVDKDMAEKFMLEKPQGALVSYVTDGSLAKAAGVKEGDIIIAFDGQSIENSKQLQNLVSKAETGKKIITVMRDGQKQDLEVTIKEMPSEGITWRGLTLQELTDERAEELAYKSDKGVLITSVESDSRSAKAGLKVDDLIVEVERQAISKVSEFQDAVKGLEGTVLVRVQRGEIARFVIVK